VSQTSIPFGPSRDLARPRIVASFSMGRSSALMTKLLRDHLSDQYEILVLIANTTQERNESLLFGHQCDAAFGFNAVWLEAEIRPELGAGTEHRVSTAVDGRGDASTLQEPPWARCRWKKWDRQCIRADRLLVAAEAELPRGF
jgi:hypothetical protein